MATTTEQPPSTLPADFGKWDAAPPAQMKGATAPPATLPADFGEWDSTPVPKLDPFKNAQKTAAAADPKKSPGVKAAPQPKATPPATLPADHKEWDKKPPANTLRAYHPSQFQSFTRALSETQTGQVVESSLDQLGRMWKGAAQKLNNPGGLTDQEWAERQKEQTAFFEKHLGKNVLAGAAEGGSEFAEELASPSQIALLVGTMGESGLVSAAEKVGVPGLATAAKTISKLAQVQFASQMIEGTATAAENAGKAAWSGDWEGAGKSAIEGLASGFMTKGIVSHEVASERVHRDLDATAQQAHGKTFDQLNAYDQGLVIDQTVKQSQEYQEVLKSADEQQEKGKADTRKQRQKKLAHYYDTAVSKAWQPDAAKRAMDGLQRAAEEDDRHEGIQNVVKTIKASADARAKAIQDEQDTIRQAGREERPERRQAAAGARSERQKLADVVKDRRDEVYAQRQEAQQQPAEVAQRDVEAVQGEDGAITYPANYWGEENSFGVTGDIGGHGIFRQTPRGYEFLDTNGNFSEAPEEPFIAPDPAMADTVARLSSLSATADTLADAESATKEQKADAEKLASIRRDLVTGEIDTREAQRQAGIAEKVTLSDEFTAARDGELTGPFHDSSAGEYQSNLLDRARELGMDEEGVQHLVDSGAAIAREQTENNLHHVYRPGDHIISKRGVKWTLDAKGLLHPDDGGPPVPLMRNGFYSNNAIQLAESGRIGYGTQTREERRIAAAKRRTVEQSIRESQEAVAREMRLSQQAEGLQLASGAEPRIDAEGKQERERRRMSRPPRAPESPESQIVRMIFRAPSDASSVINGIARAKETTPEEVMRLSLATDPAMSGTPEQKIAGLEAGDRIVEPIRKKPWVVEVGKDGQTYLRSGNAQPIRLDRLNPSDAVKGIIGRGEIEKDQLPTDPEKVAFENPHYVRWQEDQVADVEAEKPAPKPVTEKQADVQVQVAERRATAAISVATKRTIDALDPKTTSLEKAEEDVAKAQEAVKTAEKAYGQQVEAEVRKVPEDAFPRRAPISVGLRGDAGVIVQNGKEIPFHYELVPEGAIITSHEWQGDKLVENPRFSKSLQPRTISEGKARKHAANATREKYDIRQLLDRTINATMGPPIIDEGGETASGNTRMAILRKHLQILQAEPDIELRQALMLGMKSRLRQHALESGIQRYPDDGSVYLTSRMLDKPIETEREAAELGRLFNKKIGHEIDKSAMGISYSKAFTPDMLQQIGRLIDRHDSLKAAIDADPDYFNNIVTDDFDVSPEEEADWFREIGADDQKRKVLTDEGKNQFVKALLGTVIKDTSVLNRIEGETPYIALERALSYVLRMHDLPQRDITSKIVEAMTAAADTKSTLPELSRHNDKWSATYHPDQQDFLGMEAAIPPEPDRMVEVLWRALHAGNRTLNDRLKAFIDEETSAAGWIPGATNIEPETPAQAFNRAFRKELQASAHIGGGPKEITAEQMDAAVTGRLLDDVRQADSEREEVAEKKPEQEGQQKTAAPTKYKFGNTQASIPRDSEAGRAIITAQAAVSDTDLAGKGKDVDEPHITVRYGIQGGDPAKLRKFIESQLPFDAKLGKTDSFPPSKGSDGAAVIIAPVESPELHRINAEIEKHADFKESDFSEYRPHATVAYVRPEAAEKYRGLSETEGKTFHIGSIDISNRDGSKETVQLQGKRGGITRPPAAPDNLAEAKAQKGYVTPDDLKKFLEANPATKKNAPELLRTAKLMAEYVYDIDPPVGTDRKEALDWVLRERLAGIASGELKGVRGAYSDPNIEKGFGDGIMRLHKAADPTTFIHEFAHVIFPLLSDDDLRTMNRIIGDEKRPMAEWDGQRSTLKGEAYAAVSEKFAHGLEKFLRDENPAGFTHEVKAVLAKVKDIMRKVYLSFRGDPLSDFHVGEAQREVFAKMFGITDFDLADDWREEVKKARAEEKRIKRPSEEKHPLVKLATEMGADSVRASLAGKVEDSVGNRIDPRKPTVTFAYGKLDRAMTAWTAVTATGSKIPDAELIQGDDGQWGIRFNTKTKVPPDVLMQGLPERHPGVELEDLEKRFNETPPHKMMERKLLQLRMDNLRNRIRAEHGAEEAAPREEPGLAKAVAEEVKSGRTDSARTANDGVSRIQKPGGLRGISKPSLFRMPGDAGAGKRGEPAGRPVAGVTSLAEVKPVNLVPLARERAAAVGTVKGQPFDAKAWEAGLKSAMLPENAPPPTYALDPRTAQILKFPGQKQVVQMTMSALEQGDGFVTATGTGTGKSYTAMGTAWEFRSQYPDAKILHITKNRGLLKDVVKVAANSFGMEVDKDVPEGAELEDGIYGTTYAGLLNNKIYAKIPWDLVLADESGEARNWFRDENKQGKALIDVVNSGKKAVYYSATPFHNPMEYGYLTKLNLWPKGQFDKWVEQNFAHEKIGDKVVARLDPSKQAKLRQQLIERGQLVSQGVSYEGYNAHFGVVPVTDETKRSLDRIREGFARARDQFVKMGKKGMAEKTAAFEATYTKAFMERARIPQAIELAKRAREQGWQVMFFSETSAEDLFRRPRGEDIDPSTYQQLDDAMGGTLSKIIPTFEDVYERLREEFGGEIVDYSGRGNTMASRDAAKQDFLTGKAPMLYTTFAAGGIGTSFHDADYPELNIKGGERPRVQINLGPPYSGVLLEQALGRPWRFGVKSDVHAVFLASDAAPDIHLMQTKVGPRMRALRAAVHGENDSLANVMQTYTDDQKVRERQDMLAYSEGDEVKVGAGSFQVRPKGRNVGINEWSQINFPSAEDAKNKGMKYGENVAEGGDWSNLFQSKFGIQPPESPENAAAKKIINAKANAIVDGRIPALDALHPAYRQMVAGASAANATTEVDINVDRDKDNAARQSMDASMREFALIPYQGITLSQEQGLVNIARLDGKAEVGKNLRRMNRDFQADKDTHVAQSLQLLQDSFKRNNLEPTDDVMKELWYVVEGKRVSENEDIMRMAADISDMMGIAHDDLAKVGEYVRSKSGAEKIPYTDFPRDPHYMPHKIDYDAEITDPDTGEKVTVRQFLKIDEKRQQRMIDSIPELRSYSRKQIVDYIYRNDPRAPAQSSIRYAREVNFPFIKRDYKTLMGYFDQVATSVSAARHFGPDSEKLNKEIRRLDNPASIDNIQSMFHAALEPQDWQGATAKMYRAAVDYEATSKMIFSAVKVPFHLVLGPLALHGRVMPHIRAFGRLVLHPKEVMENAAYAGTIVRQAGASGMLFGENMGGATRQILRKEGFEYAYRMVRTISGEAARVYMDQYALNDLKKGGTRAEETRRLLKEVLLVGDHGIDEAIRNGRFTQEELAKGQVAFTNMAAFSGSGDPMQMPQMARMPLPRGSNGAKALLFRSVRLTYALQSFSTKAMSLMREHLFDEVVVHGNYKPLVYVMSVFPILGTVMNASSTGAKHIVKHGLEGAAGRKHTEDSWDRYLKQLEDTFGHPEAAKILRWYIDSLTLSAGAEMYKTLADPLLNIATGKPAKADTYWLGDVLEHVVGSFFTDLYKTGDEVVNLQKIAEGQKHPELKGKKEKKSLLKYAVGQIPSLREIPWVDEELQKKDAKPKTFSY